MSQPYAEALSWVPKSRDLAMTLARALDYAKSESHRTVTLEHLLLALITDKDAANVLRACQVDLDRLTGDVSSYLAESVERLSPGEPSDPAAAPELIRIVEYAAAAARQSRRREVNGAIVLAAIVGDGQSAAASMLRDQGLTFDEAIKALQRANAAARGGGQSPTQPAPEPGQQGGPSQQAGTVASGPQVEASPPRSGTEGQISQGSSSAHDQRNAQTGSTIENILAAARRRVAAGMNGARQPSESPAAPDSVRAAGTRDFSDSHYPNYQPHPAARPGVDVEPGPQPSAELESLPRKMPRSDSGGHGRDAPPMGPSVPHGVQPYPSHGSDHLGGSYTVPQGSDPRGPSPAPRLDWPRHASVDGYHWPQAPRDPGARRPPPPPPMAQQPAQGAPRAHPAPPPHSPAPPPHSPREAPWSASAPPPPPKAAFGNEMSAGVEVFVGQLAENIPRRMTALVPELVEVRVPKAQVRALAERLQGSGTAYRHDVVVTKAMSVRLRAPEGGFWIETASPETQWIENTLGLLSDDYASWRWIVTPQRPGKARLQLIVSARTVGADGLAAETALPDQVIEVKVRTNYQKVAIQWGGWIAAAGLGAILARFGEGIWDFGSALLTQIGLI